jgi:hypothetical protein
LPERRPEMQKFSKISAAAVGIAAAVALAACSGKATTTSTTQPVAGATSVATPDLHALGTQYLQIVAPANAAFEVARPKLNSMPAGATGADLNRLLAPYIAACAAQDEALLRVAWPAAFQTDVRTLVTADRVHEAYLGTAGTQNAFSIPAWMAGLSQDIGAVVAAVSVVRADLGLPPIKPQ